ncbi:MAG: T9SS type A sorting domain-containing protein, partial [Flavobacteriales bacterium]
ISASRVFMGGGGGGGEGNDDVSTDGAAGGGIILIQAGQLITSGACASRRISADGGNAANSGNDGAGGGGAGGSIVLQVPLYAFDPACTLTIRANGGGGGSVNSSTHGGGGGGGQGTVIFSTPVPTGNVSVQTTNGIGGCNETPCVGRAGSGAGSNNAGILPGGHGPLPIELIAFEAWPEGGTVRLHWSTATERNNALFTVQRSMDLDIWADVAYVPGAINSQVRRDYDASDAHPLPNTSYYRLAQTDVDGTLTWSEAVPVQFGAADECMMSLFPNPVQDRLTVLCSYLDEGSVVNVLDAVGRRMRVPITLASGRADLRVDGLMPGTYFVQLEAGGTRQVQRFVVRAHSELR